MAEQKVIEMVAPTATNPGKEAALQAPSVLADKFKEAFVAQAAKEATAPVTAPSEDRFDKERDYTKNPIVGEKDKLLNPIKEAIQKAQAVAPAGDDAPPENAKSEEAKSSWAKIKAARDEAATKAAALEAELQAIKSRFDPDAFEKTKKENEELSQTLRRLNVELHPKFKETYDKPLEEAVSRAKKHIATESHAEVDKWLRQPDSPDRDAAITRLTESLPVHKQAAFIRYVEDASQAVERKGEALKNEAAFIQQFTAQEKAAQEQARLQAEAQGKAVFQAVLKNKFADHSLFTGEDAATHIKEAEKVLFGTDNSPEYLAETALNAQFGKVAAPLLVQAYQELERMTKLLDGQISKAGGKSSGDSASTGKPKTMWEAIAELQRA